MFLCVSLGGFELTAHWFSCWDSGHSTELTWRFRKLLPRGAATWSVTGVRSNTGKRLDCLAVSI